MSAARPPERQVPWFLITGLAFGFIAGLGWAWWGDPVQYQNVSPAGLRADYRSDYRGLVALAYASNGDVGRARARLEQLDDKDTIKSLEDQAAGLAQEDLLPDVTRALIDLAEALRMSPVVEIADVPAETDTTPVKGASPAAVKATQKPASGQVSTRLPGGTPAATLAPMSTFTPPPTHTPSATPGAPFALVENVPTCEVSRPGLMTFTVLDTAGQPVAGIPILVTWPGGQDLFFTGLAPEISLGYADFVMSAGTAYTARVGENGAPVGELEAQECPSGLGGLNLTFRQP